MKQVGIAKKLGLSLIWLPFIYKKWNMKIFYKNFDRQLGGFAIENLTHPWAIPCQRSEKKGQRQKVDFFDEM